MNKKCQIFTPNDYVEKLLDSIGYKENIYQKSILENSCGDGNILVLAAERFIDDSRNHGVSDKDICKGLSECLCGVEIDPDHYKKCIENLDETARMKGLGNVSWNIINADYLKWKNNRKFDFVVGNPPYITYKELNIEERSFVRKKYKVCERGKFDYCYAFIEKSITDLKENGRMSYLIPNSIFKTVFGEKLRDCMRPYIKEIYDYTHDKMFDNALIKSAIIVLDKEDSDGILRYCNMMNCEQIEIPVARLHGKWFFATETRLGEKRFGDYFQVSHVVATLLNKAYVLNEKNYEETKDYYQCNGRFIEKDVVRETATPRSMNSNTKEMIIFPYKYEKGKLIRYTEEQFGRIFPGAEKYLNDFRESLNERASDSSTRWFEYGRTQALSGLNKRKLLISTVVTDRVNVYVLKKDCIPYAGMYIVPKADNKTYKLEDAKKILESDNFKKYVDDIGIHISGSSLRITSKDIENYRF